MSQKLEGTYHLDGLVEAPLPPDGSAHDKLNGWVQLMGESGLPFSLQFEGTTFNLLAGTETHSCESAGGDPADRVRQGLEQLLKIYEKGAPRGITSTLRCVEYRKGQEVQSIFAFQPDGRVDVRQRQVETATIAPEPPLSPRERNYRIAFSAVVALLLVLVLGFFFRDKLSQTVERALPQDLAAIELSGEPYKDFFTADSVKAGSRTNEWTLHLKRESGFPLTDADIEKAYKAPDLSLSRRLTLEALSRGYVIVEFFEKDGTYAGSQVVRIMDLREKEEIDVPIFVPANARPAKIVLKY